MSTQTIQGYKVFNPDFTCIGFQFEENKEYKMDGAIKICISGFHFCTKASHCFGYYDFNPNNIVCEVEALGDTDSEESDSKMCTNHLRIGRRLTWPEVLVIVNEGLNNTGHSNSGNRNSGNRNSGDRNSGDNNSGDRNSGNWNSGDRNSGDSNSGYRNSGAFCIDSDPILYLFDKPTKMKVREWENHPAVSIMSNYLNQTQWVYANSMTDEEKSQYPKYENTDGYLKTISLKEAWANMWHNLDENSKKVFTALPNFDRKIFESITGIKS